MTDGPLLGTALAEVHDAVLTVELGTWVKQLTPQSVTVNCNYPRSPGTVARDALFTEEVALRHLLAVDGMEQVEVRKILMKSLP